MNKAHQSIVWALIWGTLWAGNCSLEAQAQIQTLQTTVAIPSANAPNLPSPLPAPAGNPGECPNPT
jgi:hypothetical protein